MIVRQRSVPSFMAFASNEAYLAGLAHRTAAIEDSRLLPIVELPMHQTRQWQVQGKRRQRCKASHEAPGSTRNATGKI
jgi:hypothetical protein